LIDKVLAPASSNKRPAHSGSVTMARAKSSASTPTKEDRRSIRRSFSFGSHPLTAIVQVHLRVFDAVEIAAAVRKRTGSSRNTIATDDQQRQFGSNRTQKPRDNQRGIGGVHAELLQFSQDSRCRPARRESPIAASAEVSGLGQSAELRCGGGQHHGLRPGLQHRRTLMAPVCREPENGR
jgi:hypothetical protein